MSDRVFAVGDIHGCDTALKTLLDHLELTSQDTVVILGDVVDRGPGSRQVIEQLLALREKCQVVLITGNHDEMMIKAYEGEDSDMARMWLQVGGLEALESYGGQTLGLIPKDHIEFLKSGIDYWETDRDVFIHGNLRPEIDLEDQYWEAMRWEHLSGWEAALSDGRRIVCGHTSQKDGRPLLMDGWVCIDTFASGGGWLTALDTKTNRIYRTNQDGETQGPLWLDEIAKEFPR